MFANEEVNNSDPEVIDPFDSVDRQVQDILNRWDREEARKRQATHDQILAERKRTRDALIETGKIPQFACRCAICVRCYLLLQKAPHGSLR